MTEKEHDNSDLNSSDVASNSLFAHHTQSVFEEMLEFLEKKQRILAERGKSLPKTKSSKKKKKRRNR